MKPSHHCDGYRIDYCALGNEPLCNPPLSQLNGPGNLADPSALLVQSLLLIVSQLVLLWICIYYAMPTDPGEEADALLEQSKGVLSRRPLNFWKWTKFGTYIEFLAGLIVVLSILQIALGRFDW